MPIFHFDIADGVRLEDPVGLDCANESDARKTADLIARQIALELIDWNYHIPDRFKQGGRGGYEYFPEDGNHIFTMTQWYPRLCVYSDDQGWQNHQFAGTGEFALTFGNFKVQMTVPADHVVGSTGECQNYAQDLPASQLARWQKAQTAKETS